MSPNRTPQTPNIFDILIDSITAPLKHEKPQTRPTPHQNRSTIAPNPVKTHQTSKASNNTNDNFNFFDWLFCQNQPKAQTKFPAPPQKIQNDPPSIHSNKKPSTVEQDACRHDLADKQSPSNKIQKLGNSQIIQNHDQKDLEEARIFKQTQPIQKDIQTTKAIQTMQERSCDSSRAKILPPKSIIKHDFIRIEKVMTLLNF